MADSGVVFRLVGLVRFVSFIAAAIPLALLSGTDFMKRKNPPGESGAKQNKGARSRAFGTDSDFAIGKGCTSLPEITTVGTEQGDIDARHQWSL
jgi:hypothetical protein